MPCRRVPAPDVREQVPGLIERYQRRTVRLGEQIRHVVRELAGRASARLLPTIGIAVGRDTAVRVLLGIPLPDRAATALLGEIRALGYTGSHNLLVRYLNQGRHLDEPQHLSTRLMLTRPENLNNQQHQRLAALTAACPEMTALADLVRSVALLTPDKDNPARLAAWATAVRDGGSTSSALLRPRHRTGHRRRHRRDHPAPPQRTHRRREH